MIAILAPDSSLTDSQVFAHIWRVSQKMNNFSLCVSLSVSLSLSYKKKFKIGIDHLFYVLI